MANDDLFVTDYMKDVVTDDYDFLSDYLTQVEAQRQQTLQQPQAGGPDVPTSLLKKIPTDMAGVEALADKAAMKLGAEGSFLPFTQQSPASVALAGKPAIPAATTAATPGATTAAPAGALSGLSASAMMGGVGALMMAPVALSKLFGDGPSAAQTLGEEFRPKPENLTGVASVDISMARPGMLEVTLEDGTTKTVPGGGELNQFQRGLQGVENLKFDPTTGLIFDMRAQTSKDVIDPKTGQLQTRGGTVVGGAGDFGIAGRSAEVGKILPGQAQEPQQAAPGAQPTAAQETASQGAPEGQQAPTSGMRLTAAGLQPNSFRTFIKEYRDKQKAGAE